METNWSNHKLVQRRACCVPQLRGRDLRLSAPSFRLRLGAWPDFWLKTNENTREWRLESEWVWVASSWRIRVSGQDQAVALKLTWQPNRADLTYELFKRNQTSIKPWHWLIFLVRLRLFEQVAMHDGKWETLLSHLIPTNLDFFFMLERWAEG